MSFNLPFIKKQPSSHLLVVLTDMGRRAAVSLNETGQNFVIIQELEANGGSMRISQLSQKANIQIDELKKRLDILQNAGYLRYAGNDMSYSTLEQ